jgi:hypothetical protein
MTNVEKLTGPWPIQTVEAFLNSATIPVRLSVITSTGAPIVASHWFLFEHGVLRCATQEGSAIDRCLRSNDKCGIEISFDQPPYRGIRGQGIAALESDKDKTLLKRLHDRYFGEHDTLFREWLVNRNQVEVGISVRPTRMMSWDYSKRMTESKT